MLIYFLLICRHVTIYLYEEHSTDQQESHQRAIHQPHFFKAFFTLFNKLLKLNFSEQVISQVNLCDPKPCFYTEFCSASLK
jgi:hypothetical protein